MAFRDLGGGGGGHVGGSNAPRTVGTLGRGELSPPIKITDRTQKEGGWGGEKWGGEGEQAQKKK